MTDLEKIKLAIYTTNISGKVASDLLNKYDILASAASIKTATVTDVNSYNVIMNRTLFLGVVSSVNMTDIMKYDNLYKLVSLAMQRNSGKKTLDTYVMVYKTIAENTGLAPVDTVTPEMVESTLQTFGIEQADPEVAEEAVDNFDAGAEEAFANKGLFDEDEPETEDDDDALLNEMFGDEEESEEESEDDPNQGWTRYSKERGSYLGTCVHCGKDVWEDNNCGSYDEPCCSSQCYDEYINEEEEYGED